MLIEHVAVELRHEILVELPLFATGAHVKVCKATRHGPSWKRFESARYEVVSSSYGVCGFEYVLRDLATGAERTTRQSWLRSA